MRASAQYQQNNQDDDEFGACGETDESDDESDEMGEISARIMTLDALAWRCEQLAHLYAQTAAQARRAARMTTTTPEQAHAFWRRSARVTRSAWRLLEPWSDAGMLRRARRRARLSCVRSSRYSPSPGRDAGRGKHSA